MQRALKPVEADLLRSMINSTGEDSLLCELDHAVVEEMKDGQMGSLRFTNYNAHKMGRVLCEAESIDSDSTPLELSINLDEEGHLFELDIWKVTFAPLLDFPSPSTLRFLDPKP